MQPGAGRVGATLDRQLCADEPRLGPEREGAVVDSKLKNPWGLAFGPATPAWVANNGTDTSTLYAGGVNGSPVTQPALVVSVPGAPTGQVFNGGNGFMVGSGPARFIFSTEKGQIFGWNAGTAAELAASARGANFKGLAILGDKLYATDFKNARVDVFDSSFKPVHKRGALVDSRLPKRFARSGSRPSATTSSSRTPSRTRTATTTLPARASASSTSTARAGSSRSG